MCLLSIMTASLVSIGTIVTGRVPHKTVLQALVPLFVPLEVSNHFFFLHEHSRVAVETMEVLSENEYNYHITCPSTDESFKAVVVVVVVSVHLTYSLSPGIEPIRTLDSC